MKVLLDTNTLLLELNTFGKQWLSGVGDISAQGF